MRAFLLTVLLLLCAQAYAAEPSAKVYTGCGIILDIENGQFVVAGLLGESPASRAGVRQGDVISSVQKWRGSLDPGDRVSYEEMYNALNPPNSNIEIKIKVLRDGQAKDFTLKSARVPITTRSAPKSSYPNGKLVFVNGIAQATFPDAGRFRVGDSFYVFKSGKHIGTATLTAREGDKFTAIAQVNPQEKSGSSQLSFLKHDFATADAITRQAPPRGSDTALLATLAGDQGPAAMSADEQERVFQSYKARADLQSGAGSVIAHKPAENLFLVKVPTGTGSVSPGGSTMTYENVFVYYTSTTRFMPIQGPEQIRAGETIGFFYQKRGERYYAELIHLLGK